MNEIWKDVPLYKGFYQISSLGRVKSVQRLSFNGNSWFVQKEKIMKPQKTKNGYLQICFCQFGVSEPFYVHRIVAEAFIKRKHKKEIQVNHKDGNKENNSVENLEWTTPSKNMKHSYRVLKRKDSAETRLKKSLSKRGEKNFFYGKNTWWFRETPKNM